MARLGPWLHCAVELPVPALRPGHAPAMAAGNTCGQAGRGHPALHPVRRALSQEIGIPDGVINAISARRSDRAALSRNPNLCRMSSSAAEVGRMVARDCGHNLIPVKLELGAAQR